jgi:hypothetical protein
MTGPPDDELRSLLARIDPAPAGSPVDPVTSPRAREMVERAMNTPEPQTLEPPRPTDEPAVRRRRRWLLPAVAAAVVAVLVGAVVALSGGSGGTPDEDPSTLALSLPAPDVAASCIVFDVEYLAQMPVAFAGTVTAVDTDSVTLDVDRWYRGGDADQVTVAVPSQQTSAALDGVDFRQGLRYLVTATDGTVNGCGFSGPAEPRLEQAFEQAFDG